MLTNQYKVTIKRSSEVGSQFLAMSVRGTRGNSPGPAISIMRLKWVKRVTGLGVNLGHICVPFISGQIRHSQRHHLKNEKLFKRTMKHKVKSIARDRIRTRWILLSPSTCRYVACQEAWRFWQRQRCWLTWSYATIAGDLPPVLGWVPTWQKKRAHLNERLP